MKILTLCGFLFLCLLCLNVFGAEGQRVKRRCCSKVNKVNTVNKNPHKGISFKVTPVETRRPCKPCHPRVFSGPLPQLK